MSRAQSLAFQSRGAHTASEKQVVHVLYAWNIETKSNHERERVFDGRSRPKGTGHVTMRRVAQAALPLPITGLCTCSSRVRRPRLRPCDSGPRAWGSGGFALC